MKTSIYSLAGAQPADRRSRDRGGRLQSVLANARDGFFRARRRRLAIRDLRSLSDRQLDDIGIERHRIPEVIDGLLARYSGTGATASGARRESLSARCGEGCPA